MQLSFVDHFLQWHLEQSEKTAENTRMVTATKFVHGIL